LSLRQKKGNFWIIDKSKGGKTQGADGQAADAGCPHLFFLGQCLLPLPWYSGGGQGWRFPVGAKKDGGTPDALPIFANF
jgi:hypothetical protein